MVLGGVRAVEHSAYNVLVGITFGLEQIWNAPHTNYGMGESRVPTVRTGRIGPHAKASRTPPSSSLRSRQIKRKIRQILLGEAAPRSW